MPCCHVSPAVGVSPWRWRWAPPPRRTPAAARPAPSPPTRRRPASTRSSASRMFTTTGSRWLWRERTHLSCSLLMSVCSLSRYSASSSEWPSTTRLWARSLKIFPTWIRTQTSWFLLNLISTSPQQSCRLGLFRTCVGGRCRWRWKLHVFPLMPNTDSTVERDCCNF